MPEAQQRDTLLTDAAPSVVNAGTTGWATMDGAWLSSFRREDSWYAVLSGVDQGHGWESDDYGPYPTREAAEQAARADWDAGRE